MKTTRLKNTAVTALIAAALATVNAQEPATPGESSRLGLDKKTIARLSKIFDPAADQLVQTALAKIQGVEKFPAFHLKYRISGSKNPIPQSTIRTPEEFLRLLAQEYAMKAPWYETEIVSLLTHPDNPKRGFRHFAIASSNWKNGVTSLSSSDCWDGKETRSIQFDEDPPGMWRWPFPLVADQWPLGYFELIDTLPSGEGRIPINRHRKPNGFAGPEEAFPMSFARFKSMPDEDFCGNRCAVVEGVDLPYRLYLDRKTGHLRGLLRFRWMGRLEKFYWQVAGKRLNVESFATAQEMDDWKASLPREHQALVIRDATHYLTNDSTVEMPPANISRFTQYVSLGNGVELPTKMETVTSNPTDRTEAKFEYRYSVYQMTSHSTTVDKEEFKRFLPKPGFKVVDTRFDTRISYPYRDDMTQKELDDLLRKARGKKSSD